MLNSQQIAFAKVLNLVEESGCMPYVMLIGSWTEFAYREARLLGDFAPSIKTMDVDFLVRNLRKPTPSAGLAAAAKEKGFYVEADRIDGTLTSCGSISGHLVTIPYQIIKHIPTSALLEA